MGSYLAERQWGTVREDYSDNGDAWEFINHEAARMHIDGEKKELVVLRFS
jgi:hypothetical protein